MRLQSRWLGISPDGVARVLVRVRLYDAHGKETRLIKGGDFDFTASSGRVQWQTRLRFGGPAAIVSTSEAGRIVVRAQAKLPAGIAPARLSIDTRRPGALVIAAALGPHMAQIGWFPRERDATLEVIRTEGARSKIVGLVAAPSSTYRDTSVVPGHHYRYTVRKGGHAIAPVSSLDVPPEVRGETLDALRGKGMWLFFSPSPRDDNWYGKWDVERIVDLAAAAGLHHIELRVAYGEYWEVTSDAKASIDALIDRAAARGIAVIAWTVPREASFDDLAQSVAAAQYTTAAGHRFGALAIDLERGAEFMGSGAAARAALGDYARLLRAALGKGAVIVATLEDPALGRLSELNVPYRTIAANVDALQPMVYWRALDPSGDVGEVVRRSIGAIVRAAGRRIPVSVGGQTAQLSRAGAPSPAQIMESLRASRRAGAIGETFFDWDGTLPTEWDALAAFRW